MLQEFIGNEEFPDLCFDMRVLVRANPFSPEFEILAAMVRYQEGDFRTNLRRGGKAIPLTGKNRDSRLSDQEGEILEFLEMNPYDRTVPEEVVRMLGMKDQYDRTFAQIMALNIEGFRGLYGYDFISGYSMSNPPHNPPDKKGWYFLESNADPALGILKVTGTDISQR